MDAEAKGVTWRCQCWMSGASSRFVAFQVHVWRKRVLEGGGAFLEGIFKLNFFIKNILIVYINLNLIRDIKNIDKNHMALSVEVKVQNLSKTKITRSFNTHKISGVLYLSSVTYVDI